MLQAFFALFTAYIIFVIIKIGIPLWRFMVKEDAIVNLYVLFNELLKRDFQKEIEVSYGKYKLKFANTHEASIEFEKLIHEALECYDQLAQLPIVDDNLKSRKDKLVKICHEVRTLRWKQGI